MSEYYCPHCGADLEEQLGFNPQEGYWTCTECGQFLTDPESTDPNAQYYGVDWFCDGCGAYLNKQRGFSDWDSTWTCTECGYINRISEDEIYESEKDYHENNTNDWADTDNLDDTDDDNGYGEEWQYDNPRRCEYCNRLLNMQYGYSDQRESFTCEKCGHYNVWSNDEEEENENSSFDFSSAEFVGVKMAEYVLYLRESAKRRAEEEQRRAEEAQRKEEERRVQEERKRERRRRVWGIITRKKLETGISSNQCRGMHYEEVVNIFKSQSFYNINTVVIEDLSLSKINYEGSVENVTINNETMFDVTSKFLLNAKVVVFYHMLQRVVPPLTSRAAKHKDIDDVVEVYVHSGFVNIEKHPIFDLAKGWFVKNGAVETVAIDGRTDFKRNERIRLDAHIIIGYHAFKQK